MQICYVLSYRAPDYIRTRSILSALRQIPEFTVQTAINTEVGLGRYFETYRRAQTIKEQSAPDAYLLGFRGHEFYWPLRHLAGKTPIIIDAMMSPYGALARELKFGRIGAIAAYPWGLIERSVLRNADLVLTDTEQHVRFYQQEFGLAREKLLAIPVGAIEPPNTAPGPETGNVPMENPMSVLFYGSFLPLHGIHVILEAAARIRDLPVRFDFIGGSARQAKALKENCAYLGVTQYTHISWMPFEDLINVAIPSADLCLGGPFGGTPQARKIITGKASQSLALGKATLIGHIDEDVGLEDKKNCLLVPQADPNALADALRWAYHQRQQLPNIGMQGKALYSAALSVAVIRRRLREALSQFTTR